MILYLGQDPDHEDPFKWSAIVAGPVNSPYEGGKFKLGITIPEEYPLIAPKVIFVT